MKKKLLAVVLVLSIFSMGGCGIKDVNLIKLVENGGKVQSISAKDVKTVKKQVEELLNQDKPLEACDVIVEALKNGESEELLALRQEICDHAVVVESVTTYDGGSTMTYLYNEDGKLLSSKSDYNSSVNEYDSKGNLIKSTFYEADGSISYTAEYEYDANNNNISYAEYDQNGVYSYGNETKYDADNRQIKAYSYREGKKLSMANEYMYFPGSDKIKTATYHDYDEMGIITYTSEMQYNEEGQFLRIDNYEHLNKISSYTEYKYDDKGNEIEERSFDNESNELTRYIATDNVYDKDGNVTSRTQRYPISGDTHYYVYEYDKNGNVILYSHTYDNSEAKGAFGSYETYEYNEAGDMIKRTSYDWDKTSILSQMVIVEREDGGREEVFNDYEYNQTSREIYDKFGNLVGEEVSDMNDVYVYEYNSLGYCLKNIYNGQVTETITYKYHYNPNVTVSRDVEGVDY